GADYSRVRGGGPGTSTRGQLRAAGKLGFSGEILGRRSYGTGDDRACRHWHVRHGWDADSGHRIAWLGFALVSGSLASGNGSRWHKRGVLVSWLRIADARPRHRLLAGCIRDHGVVRRRASKQAARKRGR